MADGSSATFRCGHPQTSENSYGDQCRTCVRARQNAAYRARTGAKRRVYASLEEQIEAHLTRNKAHWLWSGPRRADGSCVCLFRGKKHQIARELWERQNGPLGTRRLYRVCDVHGCVRPDCHEARQHGWHIARQGAPRGKRGKPKPRQPKHYIYGTTPERAAIFGLIDETQYLALYGLRRKQQLRTERVH